VLKGQSDPPLLPDSEYPPWLWDLLEENVPKREPSKELEIFFNQDQDNERTFADFLPVRKALRRANKQKIRKANFVKAE